MNHDNLPPDTRSSRPSRPSGPPGSEGEYFVLGGGQMGETIAKRLDASGYAVLIVDPSYDTAEIPGIQGDPTDPAVLDEAGLSKDTTAIVATRSDRRNLLIAQLVRAHFSSRVVVLANNPDRTTAIADAGHEPICVTTACSDRIVTIL